MNPETALAKSLDSTQLESLKLESLQLEPLQLETLKILLSDPLACLELIALVFSLLLLIASLYNAYGPLFKSFKFKSFDFKSFKGELAVKQISFERTPSLMRTGLAKVCRLFDVGGFLSVRKKSLRFQAARLLLTH